jgi:LysR family glycine cleavage system transcriptional activator
MVVAAPSLAATLDRPEHLSNHTLLLDDVWEHHWTLWRRAARTDVEPAMTSTFSLFSMAVDSALRGEGFLVARRSLVEPSVSAGSLVEPFSVRTPTGDALAFDIKPGRAHDWLVAWANTQLVTRGVQATA